MSTKVRILGWSARGLRCPDYDVSFEKSNGDTFSVSLIQMPNGTGKTTTLNLLRAALSGAAEIDKWDAKKVRSFQKKNNPQEFGEFQVRFEANGQRVTISMIFDFEEGTVKYSTTVGKGKQNGFKPPRECSDFLNTDFIDFFVFDGELARRLLDPQFTNAEKAIENLYKLKHLKSIEKAIKEFWDETIKSAKVSSGDKALTQRRNKVTYLTERLSKLEKEKVEIENTLQNINYEINKLKNKYEEKIRQQDYYGKEYEEKKALYEAASEKVNKITQQLLKMIRSPHILSSVFADSVLSLKRNLDKVKLPESTAKEFFQELANEEECICGRKLDEVHRKYIRDRAANYLGSEEMALLNNLKGEISDQIGENPKVHEESFKNLLNEYRRAIQERYQAKTDLDALEVNLTDADKELQDARNKIHDLEQKQQNLMNELKKYFDQDDSLSDDKTFGIEVLRQRLKDAEQKLMEILGTIEIKQKIEILLDILAKSQIISHKLIANNIRNTANERIMTLLPNNDIRISKIEKALFLEGQDAGSEGETLSVAYAFMSTLYSSTDKQLPFIVDSPAIPIDLKVRAEVAQLIPKLTDQFIAFTISSERNGFLLPLEKACQEDIQYITLFRKGDKSLEEQARNYSGVTYTEDGVLVAGREFFWNFHKENEGEE